MWARSQTSGDMIGECCRTRSSSEIGASRASVCARAASSSARTRSFAPALVPGGLLTAGTVPGRPGSQPLEQGARRRSVGAGNLEWQAEQPVCARLDLAEVHTFERDYAAG